MRVLDDAPAPPATSPEFALVEDPPTPAAAAGGPPPVFASPPQTAPAPAAPAKVVANDAQTGLKGLELKNAAADAKSGDDVSAALKARRSK